jgi:retinol dehydrogenase-12
MLAYLFGWTRPWGYSSRSTGFEVAQDHQDRLNGKYAVITGANSGLGKETARCLAAMGVHVTLAVRNVEQGESAVKDIKKEFPDADCEVERLDLADLASVRSFADKLLNTNQRIDILINNAGVMACPLARTKDGFEMQIGTNHFGHFLLTNLLLDRIKESGTPESPSRIVVLASLAHHISDIQWDDINFERSSYSAWKAYGQSKTANILFAKELDRRLVEEAKDGGEAGPSVLVTALHPGSISTPLGRHAFGYGLYSFVLGPFLKTIPQGTATSLVAAASPKITQGGLYLSDCFPEETASYANNVESATRLWTISMEAVGL